MSKLYSLLLAAVLAVGVSLVASDRGLNPLVIPLQEVSNPNPLFSATSSDSDEESGPISGSRKKSRSGAQPRAGISPDQVCAEAGCHVSAIPHESDEEDEECEECGLSIAQFNDVADAVHKVLQEERQGKLGAMTPMSLEALVRRVMDKHGANKVAGMTQAQLKKLIGDVVCAAVAAIEQSEGITADECHDACRDALTNGDVMTCVAGQKMVRTELKSYGASHVGGMTAVQLKKLISAVLDGRSEAKKARIEESNVDSKPALNTPADRARHYLGRACSACNRAPAWAQMMAVMIARELVRAGTGY